MASFIHWALFFTFSGCWFRTTHAQTLFYVSESQPAQTEIIYETFSLSAVGVGTDGATTYIQNVIESYAAFVESATTVTLMSTIATYTNTIIEDASGFREYSPLLDCGPDGCKVDTSAGPVVQTCTFGTDGHGTCVEKFPFLSEGVTYSGAVVPYYTLNNTATAPNTKATSHIGAIVGGVVGGVVLGLLGAAFLLWRRRKRRWHHIEHGSSSVDTGTGPPMTTVVGPSVHAPPPSLIIDEELDASKPHVPHTVTPSFDGPNQGQQSVPPAATQSSGPSPRLPQDSDWSLRDLKRTQMTGLHHYGDTHTAPDELVQTSRGLMLSPGRAPPSDNSHGSGDKSSAANTEKILPASPQAPLVTSSHDGASESKDVFQELQTLREEMRRLENGNVLREQALREEIRRMEVGAPPNYA